MIQHIMVDFIFFWKFGGYFIPDSAKTYYICQLMLLVDEGVIIVNSSSIGGCTDILHVIIILMFNIDDGSCEAILQIRPILLSCDSFTWNVNSITYYTSQ